MTDERFWEACGGCDLKGRCYALHNAQTIQDKTAGPHVIERLKTIYAVTHLRDRLHITLRDLRSALAFTLVGTRDCDEIHELYRAGRRSEIVQSYYFNSWKGGDAPNADRLLTLLSDVDVAEADDPRLDRALDFVSPSEDRTLFRFERRGTYDRDILRSLYDELPRDVSGRASIHRAEAHRRFIAMARRRAYFERRDTGWRSMLPYKTADDMLSVVRAGREPEGLLEPILIAINRGEGLTRPERIGNHLALEVRRVEGGSVRSYRLYPRERFSLGGSRPRRDLFNGVRGVYVDPAKAWQPTDAPPLLASNYVTEDGGEVIYRDMEFPLTTSAATVQRLMKAELERNRRQRAVAFPANLSALRLRPWDAVTVALDRVGDFPARITGWRLSSEGGIDLTLSEEDPAVWDWNPAVDERATGESPSVVLPNPGVIAAPASITVATPVTGSFAALAVSWSAVGSAYLAGYEVEFLPASVAVWQGYGGALGATAASIPTAEPTAFRARAVARSGAVSGWRQAPVPAAVSASGALGITGGVRLSGGVPVDAVRLQVFEAASASLASAVKLATEPTALPWDRTGLTAGQTRWYWLRSVSAEGNVSALAGPVTATAL